MRLAHLVLALSASALSAAAQSPGRVVLFHNGRILVNDGRGTVATALLSENGRVVAVGEVADVARHALAGTAQRVDLGGATAVPGLQDAHGHLEGLGEALDAVDLRGCASYAELIARVAQRAAGEPAGTWVIGRGWDQNLWPEKSFPHHAELSAAVAAHPVFLERIDGHAALVNAQALELAELALVHVEEPKIQGGRVFLDADGYATGVLLDSACALVERVMPPVAKDVRRRRLLRAQQALLALGLTAVHDMGTRPETLELLKEMRARNELELRVIAYLWGNDRLDAKSLEGLPLAPDAGDLLSVPGVKLMADGALGSRGAALIEDYSDAPGERGHLLLGEAELGARVALCAERHLQPAVHAIGDRANRLVLDIYEKLSIARPEFRQLRPRVEHAQVVAPKDWSRFPAIGAVPSMQPVHATSDLGWIEARLGAERARGAYAWRALAPELRTLAFGSDFPVESPDPLLGLYAARTRVRGASAPSFLPEPSLEGSAALAGFTSGAAFACRQEDRRGRLQAGFAADLTVLDVDPVTCAPEALLKARVRMTVINGRVVYRAP